VLESGPTVSSGVCRGCWGASVGEIVWRRRIWQREENDSMLESLARREKMGREGLADGHVA
jgi:hypothetical protein